MFGKIEIKFAIALLISIHFVLCSVEAVDPARPRRCYSCQGLNCYRTSLTNVQTNCTDALDICVTIFDRYAVTVKGCLSDIPEAYRSKCEMKKNPECHKCFGELCNNLGREDFKCIECNSSDNSKCSEDTSAIKPVQCKIPTSPNSYCFVENVGNNIKRGCLTNVRDQQDCLNNAECSMCLSQDGEACNAFTMRTSAASRTTLFTSMSAVIIMVVVGVSL